MRHRQRSLLLLAVIALGFSSVSSAADEQPRTVSVVGTGTASAEPDSAIVTMAISTRAKEVDEAQAAAGRVTAAVLKLVNRLDIDRDQVDTTGATVQPNYRWNNNTEEQELRGYIVGRQMVVRVDDLDVLGRLIEGAVRAGVNQVSPPQLQSSRRKAVEREALAKAAEDARANAEVLAKALDARLGKVTQMNAQSGGRPPIAYARAQSMAADGAEATYNPADLTFTSTVSVTFELID